MVSGTSIGTPRLRADILRKTGPCVAEESGQASLEQAVRINEGVYELAESVRLLAMNDPDPGNCCKNLKKKWDKS